MGSWGESVYILKVDQTEFTGRLDTEYKGKKADKNDSKTFGLNDSRDRVVFY